MEPKNEYKTEPKMTAKMEKMSEKAEPKKATGKKLCPKCNRQMSCNCK